MAASSAFASWMMMLMMGGSMGLPLGVPPLPEDPVLAQVAPQECLVYFSSAGMAKPDPKSTNATERLFADPEIRRLANEVERLIRMKLAEETQFKSPARKTPGPGPVSKEIQEKLAEENQRLAEAIQRRRREAAVLVKDMPDMVKTMLTSPLAIYLSHLKINPKGAPDVRAGALVNLGDNADKVKAALGRLQSLLPPGQVKEITIDEETFQQVNLPDGGPEVTWGVQGKYLFIGVGKGEVEALKKRSKGTVPEWLATLRKNTPVPRVSTISMINIKALVDNLAPLGGPRVAVFLKATGLDGVVSLSGVSGLDKIGLVNHSLLAVQGEPKGILQILAQEPPITAEDLALVPRDATVAVVAKRTPEKIFKTLVEILEKVEPRAAGEFSEQLAKMEKELGINLVEDVIKVLGDTWYLFDSRSQGGMFTGLTLLVPIKDADAAAATQKKVLQVFDKFLQRVSDPKGPKIINPFDPPPAPKKVVPQKPKPVFKPALPVPAAEVPPPLTLPPAPPGFQAPPMPPGFVFGPTFQPHRPQPRIEKFSFARKEIHVLQTGEPSFPIAPSWCLTDKFLVVALYPEAIKAILMRGTRFQTLAKVPEVAEALAGEGQTIQLQYIDTRAFFDVIYPFLPVLAQLAKANLERERIHIPPGLLPSARAIRPYLGPSVMTVKRTPAGFEITSRQTLPGGFSASTIPVAIGLLVPAVQKTREAASRTQSMNNLKQIGLAMHNYADTFRTFPPAYRSSKEGKPLLSWRVLILPFIEQDHLYRQFHLDEPWDSEHNKKLIPMMPMIYRSPNSTAAPGMANYLTVRAPISVFPGAKGIGFADITDGTSNTIMAVEVSDRKAVIWSKPDDFELNEQNPLGGLLGMWPGGFLAALCDGSVRFIRASIPPNVFLDLVNRSDGHVLPPDY